MVENYGKQWELTEIEFKSELSSDSLIFYAVSKQYGKVILKILLPDNLDNEILTLKLFQGGNFCKLYEYSFEDRVCLMKRIVPADTLYESAPRNERIKIAGEIFKKLHKADFPDSMFPAYTEWFEAGNKKHRYDSANRA